MKTLIRNGRVIDPKNNIDEVCDILIQNRKIIQIAKKIEIKDIDDNENLMGIDATGKIVAPGFIDLHVHLREPGFEHKETIYSGSRACAKGGYTTVACMPNTSPALDNLDTINQLKQIIKKDSVIDIYPIAAITKGIAGIELTDHNDLFESGIIALSDDGHTTMNEEFMKLAFESSRRYNRPIITHSEDHLMTEKFKTSTFPVEAEDNIVFRDIELCEKANGILHVAHVSTKGALKAIKEAKLKGLQITCEVAPHHFALDDTTVDVMDPTSKVNPPIRSQINRRAMIEGIRDRTIDIIATDHAPHDAESKMNKYEKASFGISGIETAFSVAYTTLVKNEEIPILRIIEMMTYQPAKIARLEHIGAIEVGYEGNLVILDLNTVSVVDATKFVSKGKNTPFNGMKVIGSVWMTIHHGKIVYSEE